MEQAKALKDHANKLFADKKYEEASNAYTECLKALEGAPADEPEVKNLKVILLANRAFASIRLEQYGYGIEDTTKAIELDPKNAKAFYRRASARIALGKLKEAKEDFQMCVQLEPKDALAKQRLAEVQKMIRQKAFEEAISTPATKSPLEIVSESITQLQVPENYKFVVWPEDGVVNEDWVVRLRDGFKNNERINLKVAYQLLNAVYPLLKKGPTLVEIDVPPEKNSRITVFGDIHGQYYDFVHAMGICGMPAENHTIIFNGDLVDRGSWCVEVILTILAMKLVRPDRVFINRGNHEALSMTKTYGFEGEVNTKLSEVCYKFFLELFKALPLATLIGNKVFVCHGGLFSKEGVTLDEIRGLDRFREPPEEGLMCELLWSDPQDSEGKGMSKRGVGIQFGPDVTNNFLKTNNLDYVIRSHEVREEGYSEQHGGKLVTIFSAPNYCDQQKNKAAIITIMRENNYKPKFTQFSEVPHPNVPPMAYSTSRSLFGL